MREKICFIDANVFVNAFVNLDADNNIASRELLEQLEQGKISLVTDFLVMTEIFYQVERYKGTDLAIEIAKKLLGYNNLTIIAIDNTAYFEALKRAKKYKLKINDLIHYTVALLRNVRGIYSYDKDFDGLEIERIEP